MDMRPKVERGWDILRCGTQPLVLQQVEHMMHGLDPSAFEGCTVEVRPFLPAMSALPACVHGAPLQPPRAALLSSLQVGTDFEKDRPLD